MLTNGTRVRVKTWEELEELPNVHTDEDGDITENALPYSFTRYMRRFCGRTARVILIGAEGDIFLKLEGEEMGTGFRFRDWMLCEIES